jgi:hypothetical protein
MFGISRHPHLEELKLGILPCESSYWALHDAAVSLPLLSKLSLKVAYIDVHSMNALIVTITDIKSLTTLELNGQNVDSTVLACLVATLSHKRIVDDLYLHVDTNEPALPIGYGRMQVQKLALSSSIKLDWANFSQMIDDMAENSCMKYLDCDKLWGNGERVENFCALLRQNRGPSELVLTGSLVRGTRATMIIEALQANTSLTSLTLKCWDETVRLLLQRD